MGVYRFVQGFYDIEPALPYKIPFSLPFLPDLLPPELAGDSIVSQPSSAHPDPGAADFPFACDPTGVGLLTWLVYVGG